MIDWSVRRFDVSVYTPTAEAASGARKRISFRFLAFPEAGA